MKRIFKVTFCIDENKIENKKVFEENLKNLKQNITEVLQDESDVPVIVEEVEDVEK